MVVEHFRIERTIAHLVLALGFLIEGENPSVVKLKSMKTLSGDRVRMHLGRRKAKVRGAVGKAGLMGLLERHGEAHSRRTEHETSHA